MNVSPLGLLVVHGIGNQRAGELCHELASALADNAHMNASEAGRDGASTRANSLGHKTHSYVTERTTVSGVPVIVAEAYWSDLSSPDNPPLMRPTTPIISGLFETIRGTWHCSYALAILRRLDRRNYHIGSIAIGIAVLWTMFDLAEWALTMEDTKLLSNAFLPIGFLILGMALHLMARSVRYRLLRLRRSSRLRRFLEAVLWGVVSYFVGVWMVLWSLIFGAVMLFYFAIAVAIASMIAVAAAVVARALARIASVMGRIHSMSLRIWIHRLGWVMVILPVHVLLEAVKASGNLLSVILTERSLLPRIAAVFWLVGVYVAFLLLMLVCEILLMPVLAVAIFAAIGTLTAGEVMILSIFSLTILLPLYLRSIAHFLPEIDLLLDIANYHLAGDAERRSYHERIERAVVALREAGCMEIHILAHSLGTVIVYDWLQSTRPGSYPIAVLHTIGSPLDKFWYIDHGVLRRHTDQKGLAAHLSRGWTNFWAYSDPVSGALNHYGNSALPVRNERLKQLGPPLASHVYYWKNKTVLEAVRSGITRAP